MCIVFNFLSMAAGLGIAAVVPPNTGWDWNQRLQQLYEKGLCWQTEEGTGIANCLCEISRLPIKNVVSGEGMNASTYFTVA